MLQSNDLNCKIHRTGIINFACLNPSCRKIRYGCFQCIQTDHCDHFGDAKEFSVIKSEITKCEQQSDDIIKKIDDFAREAFGSVMKIKEQLQQSKQKYQMFPTQLSMTDLKAVIDEVVMYSQGKYQMMLENVDQYINDLKQRLSQSSSILIPTPEKNKEYSQNAKFYDFALQAQILPKRVQISKLFDEEKFQEALPLINEILTLDPTDQGGLHCKGIAVLNQANYFHNINQPKKAIEMYNSLIQKYPYDDTIKEHRCNNIYMYFSKFLYERQRFSKGVRVMLDSPIEISRKSSLFRNVWQQFCTYLLGDCLFHLGQYSEAISILLQIDDLKPDSKIKSEIGQCLLNLGQRDEAISFMEQAILYGHPKSDHLQAKIDILKRQQQK